ncbi:glycerate kinase [Saccharospirillum salsuginis]|uniref:Glycerate kinase n=1 Tax=Saccharospirillum salsuginis TaxID=418750 RepID=A0A918K2A8_9GAMM|nr:glycerate kinase [Saccharospirillum salsuginis]GGX45830.1 glycerate kinase [Saccharospirillum salsuginis]
MTQPTQQTDNQARRLLTDMLDAALAVAQPDRCLRDYLPEPVKGRTLVIGAGKASAAMARALEQHWPGDLEGLVVTRYGYAVPCERIEILEAAHPVPDQAGLDAAKRILDRVKGLTEDDQVIMLISGGGSALLPLPAEGISLEDKQSISQALLKSGATISEMNTVRRHLSAIKGGRLAAACHPAKVVNLLISDVPGDDPANIASGPTVGDATTCSDALAIVDHYDIHLPQRIRSGLESGWFESVDPDDPRLSRVETHLVATPQKSLEAAAEVARKAGVTPMILGDSLEGEARDVGKVMAGIARQVRHYGQPVTPPCVLLSGGETTVTVRGDGNGGRNVEYLLSLATALAGQVDTWALAADTDGVDGAAEIAGAVVSPSTLERAFGLGINPLESLANNDGHGFFQALGDSVVTGPTLTNVNDFRVVLVL